MSAPALHLYTYENHKVTPFLFSFTPPNIRGALQEIAKEGHDDQYSEGPLGQFQILQDFGDAVESLTVWYIESDPCWYVEYWDTSDVTRFLFTDKSSYLNFSNEWITPTAQKLMHRIQLLEQQNIIASKESTVEVAAHVAHEANRAYCRALGDDSQLPWDETPVQIKESVRDGVRYILGKPDVTPEHMHNNWMTFKANCGWTYGEVKDLAAKTHPNMVPYSALSKTERGKDELFCAIVKGIVITDG